MQFQLRSRSIVLYHDTIQIVDLVIILLQIVCMDRNSDIRADGEMVNGLWSWFHDLSSDLHGGTR
jgi:hypothetical protein